MVRPNQIIERNGKELTFLMFARSEEQVKRRVVALNFPTHYLSTFFSDASATEIVNNVELMTEGSVNRYAVTIDTADI